MNLRLRCGSAKLLDPLVATLQAGREFRVFFIPD